MPHMSESVLQGMFGGGSDRQFDAQELAFEAMEAMASGDYEAAAAAATRAAEIDPNCIDALHILSQLGSENKAELVENLRRTVDRAEKNFGKKFFRENEGIFWGLLETRPYMRVRAELASLLYDVGETEEAIEHVEEMLRLNPNDNQGLRYSLLGWYLELGNLKGADHLLLEYAEEGSAMFAWARVLARVLDDDLDAATAALSEARDANQYVEAYLVGRKRLPKQGPGYYSPGDESEAIVCMDAIGGAWRKHPVAKKWLKSQSTRS
ncbi:hypothetical protein NG895_01325 [Aeoliella sp. ICT_H6.2]|uniref:Tetratricopeptide repeat protein n=1 Tax=Aeoliella straminimaris TaxID=2954799 RepID=A0A9X2JEU2_9BACT|nr:hypothetical protein [Aeoliella straminimaris]MCO6042537.1 hypothetical protein [Aeoliella straminimaris]